MIQQKQNYQQPTISVVCFRVELGVNGSGDVTSTSPNFETIHENRTLTNSDPSFESNDYGGFFGNGDE